MAKSKPEYDRPLSEEIGNLAEFGRRVMTLVRFHRFVEPLLDNLESGDLESGLLPDPKQVAMVRLYWNEAKDAIANETGD